MTEREQVIAELLYLKHDCLEGSATDQTLDKAIALLKAQEPHLLTEDDFIDNPRCDRNGCLPVWVEYRTGHCGWTKTSAETMHIGMFAWGRQKYRYWTDKPTKEQMKEMKWND